MATKQAKRVLPATGRDRFKPLDFIVIGAPKSGTTALFQYIQPHPQIYLPPDKEIPFFSRDEWFDLGWEWFVGEFFSRAPADTLWGTVTPPYMEDLRAPERIFETMPQVKLIALLRNPVDRAFSYYRMQVRRGRDLRSFEEIVSDQLRPESVAEARALPWDPTTTSSCYLVRSEYARILRRFLCHFPLDQLLVLFADDLKQRPQFILDTILDFIGLQPDFSPPNLGQQYHVGGTKERFPRLIGVSRKVSPLKWFWRSLPKDHRRAFLFWFRTQFNVVSETPSPLDSDLRGQLVEFYYPDVLALETLIGRQVPWTEFNELSDDRKVQGSET